MGKVPDGLMQLKDAPHLLREIVKYQTFTIDIADRKASFVLVIAGLIATFSAGVIAGPDFIAFDLLSQVGFAILTAGMVITVLTSIHVVSPRREFAKSNVVDLFYYRGFKNRYDMEGYIKELEKCVKDPKKAVRAFGIASYLIGKTVDSKMRFVRISMDVLKVSIILGAALIILGWLL